MELVSLISLSAPSGLELTFYSGVYGTSIGAMTQFGKDAKGLIGISGICIGIGEILGESSVPSPSFISIHDAGCHVETLQRGRGNSIVLLPSHSLSLSGQEGASLGCWTSATASGGTQWCCWGSSLTLLPFT